MSGLRDRLRDEVRGYPECEVFKRLRLGTYWVAPGQGATVTELREAFTAATPDSTVWPKAISSGYGQRTNLALTGRPLQPYDLERIAACTVE